MDYSTHLFFYSRLRSFQGPLQSFLLLLLLLSELFLSEPFAGSK